MKDTPSYVYLREAQRALASARDADNELERIGYRCSDRKVVSIQHLFESIVAVANEREAKAQAAGEVFIGRQAMHHTERRADGRFAPRKHG